MDDYETNSAFYLAIDDQAVSYDFEKYTDWIFTKHIRLLLFSNVVFWKNVLLYLVRNNVLWVWRFFLPLKKHFQILI